MITLEMFNEMVSEEIEEIKDGKRHGKFNSYYVNGSRKSEVYTTGHYENGKKVGEWLQYDDKRLIERITKYDKGEIIE